MTNGDHMSNNDPSNSAPSAPTTPPDFVMQFFAFSHLPPHLQEVSRPFSELADLVVAAAPRNSERTKALNKLLEAKDCAVRAVVAK